MKKRFLSTVSLIMAIMIFVGIFAACGNNSVTDNDSESSIPSESETKDTQGSESSSTTEKGSDTETDSESESETIPEEETDPPQLDCNNGPLIQYANQMANGVNVYFTEGARGSVVAENNNMSFGYKLVNGGNQQVTYLKNSKGKTYLQDSLDVFVRTTSGDTYYASDSNATAVTNIRRFGFYYYDLRIYGQDFVNALSITEEKELSLSAKKYKDITSPEIKDGVLRFTTNGADPYIQLSHKAFSLGEYNYISITMKSSYKATGTSHVIYAQTDDMTGFSQSMITNFRLIGDGEYHVYNIPLSCFGEPDENITNLRLDFDGVLEGSDYEISDIKLLKIDTSKQLPDISLSRSFNLYSDKLHQVAQIAATRETKGIAEVGFLVKLAEESVKALVIKDKNGLHKTLEGIDQGSIEYIGFDIDGAGILGFINPSGEFEGKMKITLSGGEYTVEQTRTPDNNTIKPSADGTDNGNDFFIGQRIYTNSNHELDAFVLEAEAERHPLTSENIVINKGSSFAEFLGYDALRGVYHVTMQGALNFSLPYYQTPQRHYIADLSFKGDGQDRRIYLMAASTYGYLESAVLLDENKMLLPVPIEVTKNFSEAATGEKNLFNKDDVMYSEAILPLVIGGDENLNYTVAHIYQNWGRYPLKQISSIQSITPYYHLSTGVTESNCITPYYVTSRAPLRNKNLNMLPDHRAASAPLWKEQPQHSLGGYHYFLQYTDADGNFSAAENIKNTIESYGPTYADVKMDYLSYDGKIKISYTHMEMPQLDENRTYYTMEYEILGDISFKDFKNDFAFYSMTENGTGSNYTQIGYLNADNQSVVVNANKSGIAKSYVLGDECPYFSYFNVPDCTVERGYINLAFLVYNYSFTIGGEKSDAKFILNEREKELFLSLNLDEVTLKKGDRFTINAILLPWGSHESIYDGSNGKSPDQNVRDVRENTLLDPLKATVVSNCELVESVYIPKLRTTNGKEATFTVSGGENNVALRIYGFDMVTVPKIYEKIGNDWVEYIVNSADAPDGEGNKHYYDGYMIYYDGDGTFSYSFVTSLTGDQERTFKIVVDTPFEGWPKDDTDDEGPEFPGVFVSAEDLDSSAEGSRGVGSHSVMTENDFSFVRIYGNNSDGEGYILPYTATENIESGSFVFIKYRIPKENKENAGIFEFYTSTKNSSPAGADKINCAKITKDGEWHVAVIDISKETHPSFAPSNDGKYYAKYLRLDFFSQRMSTSSYVDVAFIGLAHSLDDVRNIVKDVPKLSLISSGNKETVIDTATGDIISGGESGNTNISYIDPSSGYTASNLLYAACLDMINGTGVNGDERLFQRGGNSNNGVDVFEEKITTVNNKQIIFSGWTVIEGGAQKYLFSCDGGKTWQEVTLANGLEKIKDGTTAHLSAASQRLAGQSFKDTANSIKNCVYQGNTGLGAKVPGLVADLSGYSGKTVSLTFAAVPASAPNTLCLIAHLKTVVVE